METTCLKLDRLRGPFDHATGSSSVLLPATTSRAIRAARSRGNVRINHNAHSIVGLRIIQRPKALFTDITPMRQFARPFVPISNHHHHRYSASPEGRPRGSEVDQIRTGWPYLLQRHRMHRPSRSTRLQVQRDLGLEGGSVRDHFPRRAWDIQLIPVWNFWPQTLQDRSPRPNFLSNLTTTEFS